MKKNVLGRGLDALIPPISETKDIPSMLPPTHIPLIDIQPNPYQPRVIKDDEKFSELVDSIKVNGVIQPIIVRKYENGYQLVTGQRRFRASQKAGLESIPAIVIDVPDEKLLEFAIIENVQREDLNPIEEAMAYQRLITEFGYTQEEVAEKVGKNRVTIANSLRLLKLPLEIREDITAGRITAGHARAILSLDNHLLQKKLRDKVISRDLSVRQAEVYAQELLKKRIGKEEEKTPDPVISSIENKLLQFWGLKTRVIPKSKNTGKIVIFYNSPDEIEHLLSILNIDFE